MTRQVALVTGASRGIGEESAVALARDGFDVALAARGADALAGLISLTRTGAAEWGHAGVRVNALAPGWIKTELNRAVWEDPEAEKAFVKGSALQRWGAATEIAECVAFLASARSSYLTGQVIVVDGGLTLATA